MQFDMTIILKMGYRMHLESMEYIHQNSSMSSNHEFHDQYSSWIQGVLGVYPPDRPYVTNSPKFKIFRKNQIMKILSQFFHIFLQIQLLLGLWKKSIYDTPIKKKYYERKIDFLNLVMINHLECDPLLRKSQDTTLNIIHFYNHIAMKRPLNACNANTCTLFET